MIVTKKYKHVTKYYSKLRFFTQNYDLWSFRDKRASKGQKNRRWKEIWENGLTCKCGGTVQNGRTRRENECFWIRIIQMFNHNYLNNYYSFSYSGGWCLLIILQLTKMVFLSTRRSNPSSLSLSVTVDAASQKILGFGFSS